LETTQADAFRQYTSCLTEGSSATLAAAEEGSGCDGYVDAREKL
jgi:hypothetical protein